MSRLIKRYGSRKLYDSEESRYVSLEDVAGWVREGQEVRVIDNTSSADVTAMTLSQIILEEGRRGRSRLSSELLHEIIRKGGDALNAGVERVQQGVDRVLKASVDRIGPVRAVREEMSNLRTRLEQLEMSLSELEADDTVPPTE